MIQADTLSAPKSLTIAPVHRQPWPKHCASIVFSTFNSHALAENGMNTHLVVGEGSTNSAESVLKDFFGLNLPAQLHIHRIKKLFSNASFIFYRRAYRKLLEIHAQTPVHIVSTRDPGFIPWLIRIKKRMGSKVYYESHNYFMEIGEGPFTTSELKMRVKYEKVERNYLHKLDGILCLLSPQAELYRKFLPRERVHVAHPGIGKIFPANPAAYADQWIGYVGSLQEQRDWRTVFEAMKLLPDHIKLHIIGGKTEELPVMHETVAAYGLTQRVKISGWVDHAILHDLLSGLALGLVPMVDNFYNRYLTAPMKIFDYLAHGIPIVAADLPSSHEFISNHGEGRFYKPGDAKDMAAAIAFMLEDESSWLTYAKAAHEQAARLTWDQRAKRLLEIFG